MPYMHWLQDSHLRIYPARNTVGLPTCELHAARGERLSCQAAVAWQADSADDAVVTAAVTVAAPEAIAVRIRRVGFVPQRHHNTATPSDELDNIGHVPGYVPDPLFEECQAPLMVGETVAFWLSLRVDADCPPGRYPIRVHLKVGDRELAPLTLTVQVYNVTIQPRRDFPVVQWFYNDAILDWYGLQPFEETFWERVEPYMRNLPEHGQDTIYAPVFTPPLDGVKRPTQLLRVERLPEEQYRFDWTDVKRYVDLARRNGIERFEWTHFFTQWGVRNAIRIYEDQGIGERLLWDPETGATSDTYRRFLEQFMPEFRGFLEHEQLLMHSFFHVSDEPHGEEHRANYMAARAMLREIAPWIRTMDALSEIEYGRQELTDLPIPSISVTRQFCEEGIPCFTYFCCGPRGRYVQRLFDTPLVKTRMAGWLFHKFQVLGFLHWGYNYWYRCQKRDLIDPFTVADGGHWPGWAYGDTFVVYPGETGPIDSIRWEIFGESLQDLALLRTLGVDPADARLASFVDFDRFPKELDWLYATRRALLTEAGS